MHAGDEFWRFIRCVEQLLYRHQLKKGFRLWFSWFWWNAFHINAITSPLAWQRNNNNTSGDVDNFEQKIEKGRERWWSLWTKVWNLSSGFVNPISNCDWSDQVDMTSRLLFPSEWELQRFNCRLVFNVIHIVWLNTQLSSWSLPFVFVQFLFSF